MFSVSRYSANPFGLDSVTWALDQVAGVLLLKLHSRKVASAEGWNREVITNLWWNVQAYSATASALAQC